MAPPQLKSKKPKKMKIKMKPQVLKIDANCGSVLKPALARRMSTLKKKASELSTLCDVAVCVVSVGANREIETWPENQQEAKSILLKHKNLGKLGKKIEKGSFSARKGTDYSFLETMLEALNERIGVVMMRDGVGTKTRTTSTCSFMEFYENIMGTSVLPDPPDQQQSMLLVDQVPHHQQEDYSTTNSDGFFLDDLEKGSFSARKGTDYSFLETMLEALNERIGVVMMRDGVGTKTRTTSTCSFMEFYENIMGTSVLPDPPDQQQSMLLVDQVPHHQQEDYSTTNSDGFFLDDLHIAAASPTMSSIDDYVSWLLEDHNDVGLMKDYIQFCYSDLASPQDPQQQQQQPSSLQLPQTNY